MTLGFVGHIEKLMRRTVEMYLPFWFHIGYIPFLYLGDKAGRR